MVLLRGARLGHERLDDKFHGMKWNFWLFDWVSEVAVPVNVVGQLCLIGPRADKHVFLYNIDLAIASPKDNRIYIKRWSAVEISVYFASTKETPCPQRKEFHCWRHEGRAQGSEVIDFDINQAIFSKNLICSFYFCYAKNCCFSIVKIIAGKSSI